MAARFLRESSRESSAGAPVYPCSRCRFSAVLSGSRTVQQTLTLSRERLFAHALMRVVRLGSLLFSPPIDMSQGSVSAHATNETMSQTTRVVGDA